MIYVSNLEIVDVINIYYPLLPKSLASILNFARLLLLGRN